MDSWNGNVDVMEMMCFILQKELVALQEEVKAPNSLQKTRKIYGSPYDLASHVTKLEDSHKDVEKKYKVSSSSVGENTHYAKEHRKSLLQETAAYVEV